MKKKFFIGSGLLILLGLLLGGFYGYRFFYKANITKDGYLYIPTGASYTQFKDSLSPFLKNKSTFKLAARFKKLDRHLHAGRYGLSKGMSNSAVIHLISLGKQEAVSIRIGNYYSIFQMAGRVAPFLECDSQEIVTAIYDAEFTQGVDSNNLISFFIPNTYKFHWNISGHQFVDRMKSFYDKFWTKKRLALAQERGLPPMQVITLASIVQLESAKPDEQPRVANVYLNRLKIGMKLDADPTVIYAIQRKKGFDTEITRLYYKDLRIKSPYNTYRNRGLPPGPICMPNPSAIKAVLNPAKGDYLYFVADPKHPGYHLYAKNQSEQKQNARKYHQWIRKWQKKQKQN